MPASQHPAILHPAGNALHKAADKIMYAANSASLHRDREIIAASVYKLFR